MKANEINGLKNKYQEHLEEITNYLKNAECEIDIDGDEIDVIQGNSLVKVHTQIVRKNIIKLEMLKSVIEKIEEGTFDGSCDECGEDIGLKRLEVIPGVTICVKCAEEAEHYQNNVML